MHTKRKSAHTKKLGEQSTENATSTVVSRVTTKMFSRSYCRYSNSPPIPPINASTRSIIIPNNLFSSSTLASLATSK